MSFKILANFNLNQSLSDFQVKITELLKLNNVNQWNGITLKDKEEKIRETALVLAGQCIGILLNNLSKSREASQTALAQTKGWWKTKTRKNGLKTRAILTVGNVIVKLKLPYVVEIKTRKDDRKKPKEQGFCPFLRWLGMESGVTPYVWSTLAKYAVINHSFEIARQTLIDWGVKISVKRLSRGISQAKQILLIADGAEWIWQHIPPLLNQLGCEKITYYLLDFYHATEHLQSFADAAFKDDKKRITWFKTARSDLKKGKVISLIEKMKQHRELLSGKKREIIRSQINYFSKRASKGLFNYDKIRQLNLPIGSGAIESLIRQAVNLRLKGNGKFWLQQNAEIILHARCQWLSGSWNNFANSILTLRIYPAFS